MAFSDTLKSLRMRDGLTQTELAIGNIILRNLRALIIKAEPIGLHVIEPDLVRSACTGLCKNEHSGGNTGIRLKYTGRHGNHSTELMVFHELFPNRLVCCGGAEQHPVRNNAGTLTALFQHTQEQRKKQKLRLFGVGASPVYFVVSIHEIAWHR